MQMCFSSLITQYKISHNEISPHTCQDDLSNSYDISVGKDTEKREHSCSVGDKVQYRHDGKSMAAPQKFKNRAILIQ